jgi:hypothetical protein
MLHIVFHSSSAGDLDEASSAAGESSCSKSTVLRGLEELWLPPSMVFMGKKTLGSTNSATLVSKPASSLVIYLLAFVIYVGDIGGHRVDVIVFVVCLDH